MGRKRKATALFFSLLCMMCMLISVNALAFDHSETGSCGDSAVYDYNDSTHVLTISGTGTVTGLNTTYMSINEIVVTNGITGIGDSAFSGEFGLSIVTLPAGLKSIGNYAFARCNQLESVNIPSEVTSIGAGAFTECRKIKEITIPGGVETISDSAFRSCNELKKVIIADGVKHIGDGAFDWDSSLETISIPNSVTDIGEKSFRDCMSLKSVKLPENLTSIGKSAFENCSGLTEITIPEKTQSIGDYAFMSCYFLKKAVVPVSVKTIGDRAFDSNVVIYGYEGSVAQTYAEKNGNTFKLIGESSSTKPKETSKIKAGAVITDSKTGGKYKIAKDLKSITYTAPVKKTASSVVIPTAVKISGKSLKVTTVAANAFKGCRKLTTVTVGKNVKTIGKNAFNGCRKLKKVIIKTSLLKTVGTGAFKGIKANATVKVPAKKLLAYKKLLKKSGIGKKVKITK